MKKRIALLLSMVCLLSGCGGIQKTDVEITSESIVTALSSVETFGQSIIYTEETDPNGSLGKPNNYIGKADFSDTRCEQFSEEDLVGGTFEYFSTKSDCDDRYEYLMKFTDPSMGAFGLNQYVYKYSTVILRVGYDLTSAQAEEYRDALTSYLGEESEQSY